MLNTLQECPTQENVLDRIVQHATGVSNTRKTHLFGLLGGLEKGVEGFCVRELLWEQEVEQRPQLVQVVLRFTFQKSVSQLLRFFSYLLR